jgi:hypothetical protein
MLTRDRVQVEDYQGDTPLQCAVNLSRHEVSRHDRAHDFGPRRLLSLLGALILANRTGGPMDKVAQVVRPGEISGEQYRAPSAFRGLRGQHRGSTRVAVSVGQRP